MDKSEEYCRMCDCPEVQGVWILNPGDAIYRSGIVYWLTSKGQTRWIGHNETIDDIYTHSTLEYFSKSSYIWLPRQRQLQEMVKSPERADSFLLCIAFFRFFERFCAEGSCTVDITMEQLWLFFVMRELHGKKWNGEEWE